MAISIYQRYANAKKEIKYQTYIVEKLKKQVFSFVDQSKDRKVINEYGVFSIVVTPKYKYSAKVEAAEASLDALKQTEIANGTANKIENEILHYVSK